MLKFVAKVFNSKKNIGAYFLRFCFLQTYGQNRVESWAAQFDEARSQLSVLENSAAENMDVTEEDEE